MKKVTKFSLMTALMLGATACTQQELVTVEPTQSKKPNLIVVYVDDLGYADVGSYGAIGVETPNIDSLAANGIRFTDAHSSSATCTPSRYSLLTGEHAFRVGAEVLKGDAPALIRPGKKTLPAMLKEAGYRTGVVGKWHLGLGDGNVDWNDVVKPGPLEIGFDYSFLLPSTGDRVPTVYLENHRVVNLDKSDPISVSYQEKVGSRPTGDENPELLRMQADGQHRKTIINGISRIGYMGGGESALWVDEEFPDVFTDKAIGFIQRNQNQPFFLFHSFHDIHQPRLPHPRFVGKSPMGPRGDAIAQVDWMTGKIVQELEILGIADNTIIIFTSDNGPILNDGYEDQAVELIDEHKPGGPFRGGKYSAYEAGTRVPTIISWPGTVKPAVSSALLSQMDIYASMAKLVGVELDADEAFDSMDMLDVILGNSDNGREYLVEESVGTLSLRQGNWKYIKANPKGPKNWVTNKGIEGGLQVTPQLYHLSTDINEQANLAEVSSNKLVEMQNMLTEIVSTGYRD